MQFYLIVVPLGREHHHYEDSSKVGTIFKQSKLYLYSSFCNSYCVLLYYLTVDFPSSDHSLAHLHIWTVRT